MDDMEVTYTQLKMMGNLVSMAEPISKQAAGEVRHDFSQRGQTIISLEGLVFQNARNLWFL